MYSLLVLCLNRYHARKAGHLEPMQLKLNLWHPYTLRQPAFHQCICLFCTFTSYRSGKYKIIQTFLLFLKRHDKIYTGLIFSRCSKFHFIVLIPVEMNCPYFKVKKSNGNSRFIYNICLRNFYKEIQHN